MNGQEKIVTVEDGVLKYNELMDKVQAVAFPGGVNGEWWNDTGLENFRRALESEINRKFPDGKIDYSVLTEQVINEIAAEVKKNTK